MGAGIKNKILEAWSVGTPAVMTPIATNGLTQSPPELLLAAEGTKPSDLVVDLLTNAERRAELGALARSTALATFSWKGQAAAVHACCSMSRAQGATELPVGCTGRHVSPIGPSQIPL